MNEICIYIHIYKLNRHRDENKEKKSEREGNRETFSDCCFIES